MSNPWDMDEENREQERRTLLEEGEQKVQHIFSGFIEFAFSGNILEIAFGLMSVEEIWTYLLKRCESLILFSIA